MFTLYSLLLRLLVFFFVFLLFFLFLFFVSITHINLHVRRLISIWVFNFVFHFISFQFGSVRFSLDSARRYFSLLTKKSYKALCTYAEYNATNAATDRSQTNLFTIEQTTVSTLFCVSPVFVFKQNQLPFNSKYTNQSRFKKCQRIVQFVYRSNTEKSDRLHGRINALTNQLKTNVVDHQLLGVQFQKVLCHPQTRLQPVNAKGITFANDHHVHHLQWLQWIPLLQQFVHKFHRWVNDFAHFLCCGLFGFDLIVFRACCSGGS